MNKFRDSHPTDADLFLHLEGELDSRAASQLTEHLAHCWDCRARSEEFQSGIRNFVHYRRAVLTPEVPGPRSTLAQFRKRLPESDHGVPLFRMAHEASFRLLPLTSLVLIAALLTTYVLRPPSLTAAEFLRNVAQANRAALAPQKVKAQRIEIRRGNHTLEREIIHRTSGRTVPDTQWNTLLANLPVDTQDPLNPAAFERWHAQQTEPQDRIVESGGMVTLTTRAPALQASLIVRGADWHVVGERFELPGQPPVEIREITLEIRSEPPTVTTSAIPPAAPSKRLPVPAKTIEPPPADLDLTELELREVLRASGADREEVLTINRRNGRLYVEGQTAISERREQLLSALQDLPGLDLHIVDADTVIAGSSAKPPRIVPSAYPTTPPLARALWDYMGGMDPANSYLDSLRSAWVRAFSASNALHRLAQRYHTEDVDKLALAAQARLSHLVDEYNADVATNLTTYLQLLAEPLDAMMARAGVTDSPAEGHCPAWQPSASQTVRDLQSLQLSIRRLFLIDYAETPLQLSATELLNDAAGARARLRQQLRCHTQ